MSLAKTETELRTEAENELGRRSGTGCLAHTGSFLVVLLGTPIPNDMPWVVSSIACLLAGATLARYFLSRRQAAFYPTRRTLWNAAFDVCLTATAGAWGLLCLAAYHFYGSANEACLLVFLTTAGITAVSATSLAPDRWRAQGFVLVILGLPLGYLALGFERSGLPLALSLTVFLFFLSRQIAIKNEA